MKKRIVRLTESDLHHLIRESVNRILRETSGDDETSIAREKFIEAINSNNVINMNFSHFGGEVYGKITFELPDGFKFYVENIPVKVRITRNSYYRKATYTNPEEYGDAEGVVDGIYLKDAVVQYITPDETEGEFEMDSQLAEMIEEKIEIDDDSFSEAVGELESYQNSDDWD